MKNKPMKQSEPNNTHNNPTRPLIVRVVPIDGKNAGYKNVTVDGHILVHDVRNVKLQTLLDGAILTVYFTDRHGNKQWHVYDSQEYRLFHNMWQPGKIKQLVYNNGTMYAIMDYRITITLTTKMILDKIVDPRRFQLAKLH